MTNRFAPDPNPYSEILPTLQTAWDATSMDAILFCPRYYKETIIDGWRGKSVHLDFGKMVADGFETYQKARCAGDDIRAACHKALREVLAASWPEGGEQWGGYWEEQWKCDGSQPYKNAKGNKAICPYAHKKMWFPPDAPDVCGECGGGIVTARNYCPEHDTKHRINLARVMVWYALDQPENLDDGLRPMVLPDGTPAVELSWRLPLPWSVCTGEGDYLMCGHIDYVGQYGDEAGPVDNKTTKFTLSPSYFRGFSPHTQFDTYDMAVRVLFPEIDFSWVAIDAVQIMVDTIRTGRHFYRKTDEQRVEHLETIKLAVTTAERCATENSWPMNKRQCSMCGFKDVCGAAPEDRQEIRESRMHQSFWNPLRTR